MRRWFENGRHPHTKVLYLIHKEEEHTPCRLSRVSILRDLFQRGKPIPVEELESANEDASSKARSKEASSHGSPPESGPQQNGVKITPYEDSASTKDNEDFQLIKSSLVSVPSNGLDAKNGETSIPGMDGITSGANSTSGLSNTSDSITDSAFRKLVVLKSKSSGVDSPQKAEPTQVLPSETPSSEPVVSNNKVISSTEGNLDARESNEETETVQNFVVKAEDFIPTAPCRLPVKGTLQLLHAEDVAISTTESESTADELGACSCPDAVSGEKEEEAAAEAEVHDNLCSDGYSPTTIDWQASRLSENIHDDSQEAREPIDEEDDEEIEEEEEKEDHGGEYLLFEDEQDWRPIPEEKKEDTRAAFSLPSHIVPVAVNSSGVHLLEDGNFFYQCAGLPPLAMPDSSDGFVSTSENDEEVGSKTMQKETEATRSEEEVTKANPTSTRSVHFSTKPITVFSTHSVAAYKRRNDSIDPVAASAEYELEKRLEELDLFQMDLQKGSNGLGISILGMGMTSANGVEKLGIFVKAITPGGAADIDGRIRVYDQLVEVDGQCLVGVSQSFAADALRNTSGTVHFVVGRERNDTNMSIATLLEADEMTASTTSASNSEMSEDVRNTNEENIKREDSVETLRKLLADASATAAKAHEQVEPDICEEEDDDDGDEDDDDEDIFDDDDEATTDTLISEGPDCPNGKPRTRRPLVRSGVLPFEVSSSDAGLSVSECDSESDRNQPVLDISKEITKLRQRDLAITQILQEAIEKANSRTGEGYGLPSLGVSSEQTTKVATQFPKPALCALRFLASHLFNAQSQIKRLRVRIRQLGQRLTDQEAAADEAIERLCLRCHNLETRLAEKQAILSSVANEHDTTSQAVTGACNTSADQEKVGQLSPHEKDRESAVTAHSDMQSRYLSLNTLYEAALKREEELKAELLALKETQRSMTEKNSKEISETSDQFEIQRSPRVFESPEATGSTLPDNWRTIHCASDPELRQKPVPKTTASPSPTSAKPRRSLNVEECSTTVNAADRPFIRVPPGSNTSSPPRPPKPAYALDHQRIVQNSENFFPCKLNFSRLPDPERQLLDANPILASGSFELYDFYAHRLRVGTSGAFAKKRLPSRVPPAATSSNKSHPTSTSSSPLDFFISPVNPDDPILSSAPLQTSVQESSRKPSPIKATSPSSPSSKSSRPVLPFLIPVAELNNAINSLKPSRTSEKFTTSTRMSVFRTSATDSFTEDADCLATPMTVTASDLEGDSSDGLRDERPTGDIPCPFHASLKERAVRSPDISTVLESEEASPRAQQSCTPVLSSPELRPGDSFPSSPPSSAASDNAAARQSVGLRNAFSSSEVMNRGAVGRRRCAAAHHHYARMANPPRSPQRSPEDCCPPVPCRPAVKLTPYVDFVPTPKGLYDNNSTFASGDSVPY
ncbi:protein phosphatase 1 regulatory [Sparganum proliferum]